MLNQDEAKVLMSMVVSVILLVAGLLVVFNVVSVGSDVQKLAAGWIGLVA
jgi:hypothetical protein